MNWGKAMALSLIAFAALMAWFVVMAMQNPEPLVTEHYYEQELKYQARIDNIERAYKLTSAVQMELVNGGLSLLFPEETRAINVTGSLTLLRPNDPDADRHVAVIADNAGRFETGPIGLVTGRYNALLEWSAGGVTYYTEEKLFVP